MSDLKDWQKEVAGKTLAQYSDILTDTTDEILKLRGEKRIDVMEFKEYFYTPIMSGDQTAAAIAIRQFMVIFGPDVSVAALDDQLGIAFVIPSMAASSRFTNMDEIGLFLSDTEKQYDVDKRNIPVIASRRRSATLHAAADELKISPTMGSGWDPIHAYFGEKPHKTGSPNDTDYSASDMLL